VICFYHSADLDGHLSGELVRRVHPDCEMLGINYGDTFPWEKVAGQEVWMVDFGLQPFSLMQRLAQEARKLVWIDHHKSNLEAWEAEGFPPGPFNAGNYVAMTLEVDKAACELVWECLHPGATLPGFVRLIGRHDVWDHSDPYTLPFQYGMRAKETLPGSPVWDALFESRALLCPVIKSIVEEGKSILAYQEKADRSYAEACAYEASWLGHRVVVMNRFSTGSKSFDSVFDPQRHAFMVSFAYRPGFWTVHLYSDDGGVDLAAIAAEHGGGGHKGAAGFQTLELPLELLQCRAKVGGKSA
jgi:oligoribonuclease NrnB/cAMP/cGMP phosphodiesterase (DHH superfamily)